ncbi:DNA polymerase III subunit alpha, partial [bacterium]|nr:DNA polymerase III subunit alpha [bacterium]
MKDFTHLHVHSNYTLLSGANTIDEIVLAAAEMGMNSIALTDTNAMYGIVPFYQVAKAVGIKPILGTEIELEDRSIVLLAKNNAAYSSLCRIMSKRHFDEEFPMEHNPCKRKRMRKGLTEKEKAPVEVAKFIELLADSTENIFILADDEAVISALARTDARDSLYVRLENYGDYASEKKCRELVELGRRWNLPLVAGNEVRFVRPEEYAVHRLLSAIKANTTLASFPDRRTASDPALWRGWMRSPQQIHSLFRDLPEAIDNAEKIAFLCDVDLGLGRIKLPVFPVPEGETPHSYLRKTSYRGAEKRYGTISPEVRRRLEHELYIIEKLGYASYFLVVWDIARFAYGKGIPSVGRGSAANSIVSYCLELTHVCPIRHKLFFERFLNLEREDCPDVDLDFCWKRRDEVLEYVYQKYGEDRVAMICTFNTFGLRASIREVAKVMGLLGDEISDFTRRIPHFDFGSMERIVEEVPECRDLPIDKEPWKSIVKMASRIAGFPRYLGTHPGGIVIAPSPITDFMPLQYAAKGLVITQYSMDPVEDMGLVKIDLLGQRSLSVVADVAEKVRRKYGIKLKMNELKEGDRKTIDLWRKGKTIGCFQIESPCMRGLLRKLHVDNMETLIAASSLVRPGPSDSGMTKVFINRYNGKESVTYLHPALKPILRDTLGVMVYQEDVIKVAHKIAGFSFGEAEMLRKSMSKKRGIEAIATYEERFISGAIRTGTKPELARELWRQLSGFAGYAFCKAHSASYAYVSYQATYLKAHFPAEFMAAVLANGGGFYHRAAYVSEARRMDLRILPPDVNYAEMDFTGEDDWIRVGLRQVMSLTGRTARSIIASRQREPYTSLANFCARTPTTLSEVRSLVRCGAFDAFGQTRPQLLWEADLIFGEGGSAYGRSPFRGRFFEERRGMEDTDLFGGLFSPGNRNGDRNPLCSSSMDAPLAEKNSGASHLRGKTLCTVGEQARVPRLEDYTVEKKIQDEMEVLGFPVTAHPMSLYVKKLRKLGVVPARDVRHYTGRTIRVAGWLVTTRR